MKNAKKTLLAVFVTAALMIYYSYTGYSISKIFINKSMPPAETKNASLNNIYESDNSYVKDNEDLLNVDYKTYYDDLKPYGTWIAVNLSNKNVNVKSSAGDKGISAVLRNILGISDAKADIDFGWSIFYVWRPSPNLAIGLSAGESSPAYIPYTNGRWVYSDYGWYFRAATPYEEITHHYGRWVFVASEGWIWIPGSVWSPAWVSWQEDDDYVVWTPCTPGVNFAVEYYGGPYYPENNYVVCERRHFLDPEIYRFSHSYREHEFEKRYVDMRKTGDVSFAGRNGIQRGPDVKRFESDFGKRINPVNINMVSNKEKVRYDKNRYNVYAPTPEKRNQREKDFVKTSKQNFSGNSDYRNKLNTGREFKNRDNHSFGDNHSNNFRRDSRNDNRNDKRIVNSSRKNSEKINQKNDRQSGRTSFDKQRNNNRKPDNNTSVRKNNPPKNKNNNYFSQPNRQNRNSVNGRKYMDDTKMHPGNEFKSRRNVNDGGVNKNNNKKR